MTCPKYEFLPEVSSNNVHEKTKHIEVIMDSPCPCCGYVTIPNKGDSLAYICPICMWEIDLFIHDENEPSDLNHGLSLNKARENYKLFGSILKSLKQHYRAPNSREYITNK